MSKIWYERQITCYPPERYVRMIIGKSRVTGESKSQILETAIRQFFNSLAPSEQELYTKEFEKLTPEQRKRPNKT